jgi:hypothetical protein
MAGNGASGNGTAGNGAGGNGSAGSPDPVSSGREEAIGQGGPRPFWLRPVRRKK